MPCVPRRISQRGNGKLSFPQGSCALYGGAATEGRISQRQEKKGGTSVRTGDRKKRDWYFIITMGMGLLVCAASLALLVYLLRLVVIHGMDLTLAMFFLSRFSPLRRECFLSGFQDWRPWKRKSKRRDLFCGKSEFFPIPTAFCGRR